MNPENLWYTNKLFSQMMPLPPEPPKPQISQNDIIQSPIEGMVFVQGKMIPEHLVQDEYEILAGEPMDGAWSELRKMNYSDLTEIRTLLRRIARAKEIEAKESKKKGGIEKPTMSELPNHPSGVSAENDDLDPDGPTTNTETKANRLGLDPAGVITSRGGHMG